MTTVYDSLGRTIRRSRNLRGLLAHYRAKPDDLVHIQGPLSRGHTHHWTRRGSSWLHKGRRNLRCTFCLSQCTSRKGQRKPCACAPRVRRAFQRRL
jgi:hypothetical protein